MGFDGSYNLPFYRTDQFYIFSLQNYQFSSILVLGDSHLKVPINTCVGSVIFGGLLSFCNIVGLSSACYTVYT